MRPTLLIPLFVSGAVVAATFTAARSYPGSVAVLGVFGVAFGTLVALIALRPHTYVYTFFATFLFLGFWAKAMSYVLSGHYFVETVGEFDRSPQAWDRALIAAAAAAGGVLLARVIQLVYSRGRGLATNQTAADALPDWYKRWRKLVWIVSAVLIVCLNAWNVEAAFYQIGVNPRVVLPFHLNVVTAWLLNIGFALWLAVLLHWEQLLAPQHLTRALAAVIVEAFLAGTSVLSRSVYLFHTAPYFVAVGQMWRTVREHIARRWLVLLACIAMVGFGANLVTVQVLRTHVYYGRGNVALLFSEASEASGRMDETAKYMPYMLRQIQLLLVYRWIGLEGVMAVSSYPDTGPSLLRQAILENPKVGVDSLYQRISSSIYVRLEHFTFLTLPGVAGVLLYSGSLVLVFIGMAGVTALMLLTETVAEGLTRNPFLLGVAGLGMANVACQLNFPYLGAVFMLQLWVAIGFVWALRYPWLPPRPPAKPERISPSG